MPSQYLASGLVDSLKKEDTTPKKVLFPRSEIGRETLAKGLRDIGSTVDEITAYSTESPDDTGELATKAYEEGVDFILKSDHNCYINHEIFKSLVARWRPKKSKRKFIRSN